MNRLGHEFNNWLKKFRRSSSKKVHLSPVNNERFESKKLISNIPPRLQILVKIKFTITTHCSDYTKNKCVKIFRYWPRSELIFMRIFGTFLTNFRIHIYFFEWVVFDIIKWKIHSLQFLLKKLFLYRHFLICFTHEKRPVTFPHENFSWLNRHYLFFEKQTNAIFMKFVLHSVICILPAQQQQCHKNSPKRDNDSLLCLTNHGTPLATGRCLAAS